ncbi:hypothetical protein [Stratiformator vulcanicus]|uniref:Lipoprotein n=1 Tax=Stratiformator vulcanicus TaxID=2527980 RepID=A0A517R6J1_9PLAN|nr:hypothetical protein [Stratiformator vulcanicus]QDT39516.1 hypothetical protein Pan189_39240 [Stratiformator vulcanicus]
MRRFAILLLISGLPGCVLVERGVTNPIPAMDVVAIAPFLNLSTERVVDGREFANAYYGELQKVPGYQVIPVGVVEQAMVDAGINLDNPDDVLRLGQVLGADAVVVGAVTDYDPYYPPRIGMQVSWYATHPPGFAPGIANDPFARQAIRDIPKATRCDSSWWERACGCLKSKVPLSIRGQSPDAVVRSNEVLDLSAKTATSESTANERHIETVYGDSSTEASGPKNAIETAIHEFRRAKADSIGTIYPPQAPWTIRQVNSESIEDPLEADRPLPFLDFEVVTPRMKEREEKSAAKSSLKSAEVLSNNPIPSTEPVREVESVPDPVLVKFPEIPPAPLTAGATDSLPPVPPPLEFEGVPPAGLVASFPEPVWDPRTPVMSYTRVFDGSDGDLAALVRDYVELRDDLRAGGWEGYMHRSDDFLRFAMHRMIVEMLTLHGGDARRRYVLKLKRQFRTKPK